MRSTLHAALDSRCDELEAQLTRAESLKVVALERELVVVDAALERWRSETRAIQDAVNTICDTDIVARYAELTARLDVLDAQLRALPTSPAKLTTMGLIVDSAALLASISSLGRVVAPLIISASDVTLEGVPRRVRHGQTLHLTLTLGNRYTDQTTEGLEVSLTALAAATRCNVSLCSASNVSCGLQADFTARPASRCLSIDVRVPLDAPHGSRLALQVFCSGHHVIPAPLEFPLQHGLAAPLVVRASSSGPCVLPPGSSTCHSLTSSWFSITMLRSYTQLQRLV